MGESLEERVPHGCALTLKRHAVHDAFFHEALEERATMPRGFRERFSRERIAHQLERRADGCIACAHCRCLCGGDDKLVRMNSQENAMHTLGSRSNAVGGIAARRQQAVAENDELVGRAQPTLSYPNFALEQAEYEVPRDA